MGDFKARVSHQEKNFQKARLFTPIVANSRVRRTARNENSTSEHVG
jgi:hypothetical protein